MVSGNWCARITYRQVTAHSTMPQMEGVIPMPKAISYEFASLKKTLPPEVSNFPERSFDFF